MNLFRSEEHAREWAQFDPDTEKTLRPLSFWAEVFSNPIFKSRGRSDYISWIKSEEGKKARQALIAQLQ